MKTKSNVLAGLFLLFAISYHSYAQELQTFNRNSAPKYNLFQSWPVTFKTGMAFNVQNLTNENPLFKGNRIALELSEQYFFNNFGLGLSLGIIPGSVSSNDIKTFLSERQFPSDAAISKSNPSNSYILFGPAVRFGKKVQFGAELSGGLFVNNIGSLSITPQGSPRPIYSMENGDKNLYPGFSGTIHIDYPINSSTRFFISTGYLQTKSSNRIIDLKQGIDIPRLQNQDLKLFTAGIGISKTFGGRKGEKSDGLSASTNGGYAAQNRGEIRSPRDASSGLATGKRSYFRGNQNNGNTGTTSCGPVTQKTTNPDGSSSEMTFACPQDAANFRALREPPTETYNPWEMDDDEEGTVMNSMIGNDGNNTSSSSSCGPVTIRTTNPDGTVTETTFTCPQDAAQFQQRSSSLNSLNNSMPSRLSMTPTTAKQTQGKTFGEKLSTGLNSGRSIHRDSAARNNILIGKISHWSSAAEANGIATNKSNGIGGMAAKPAGMTSSSYAAGIISNPQNGNGIIASFYSREASSGLATGKRARTKDAVTGMATGRRKYQLIYTDESNSTSNNSETDIVVNPLYKPNGNSGDNPLFESNQKSISSGGGDLDRDGIPELMVSLIDPANGAVLATTKTEANGNFYFANLPSGTYAVKVEGELTQKKGYEVSIKKKLDVAGKILSTDESWAIELNTAKGTAEQAAAYVQKTRTKSNNSNDRLMGNTNDNSGLVWSPRSNFKVLPMAIADVDRDGLEEMGISRGASLLGGALGGNFSSRPGNPIGGIIVKGGKNPGGQLLITQTNNNGEFEFTNLQPGSYNITIEGTVILDDETVLQVGDDAKVENKQSFQKALGFVDRREINPGQSNIGNGDNNEPPLSKKVVEKPTSGLKDVLKTNVIVSAAPNNTMSKLSDLNTTLDELKLQIDNSKVTVNQQPDGAYKTTYSKIKDIKATITEIQKTLENQQQKTEVLKRKVAELQEILKTMGPKYKEKDRDLHDWIEAI